MNNSNQIQPTLVQDLDSLCASIQLAVESHNTSQRIIIAIAGPPGSGKSTLLATLVPMLQKRLQSEAVVGIPMDGFHLDNVQLENDGTTAVKGAPQTFDVNGLLSLMQRLYAGESPVYAPEFDRAGDMSRNCALKIEQAHNIVLVEGNYLLLNQPGWRELAKHFALTIRIDVPSEVLRERLVHRWLHYGLSEEAALAKALSNDIPNAKTVVEQSITANIIYQPENHQ